MIGDARAAGKRHSTRAHGPEFKKKLSEGQAHKHVAGPRHHDSGGDHENHHSAKSAHKKGPLQGSTRHHMSDKQAPHKQKERIELKHVDQGDLLDQWARGKRKHYR